MVINQITWPFFAPGLPTKHKKGSPPPSLTNMTVIAWWHRLCKQDLCCFQARGWDPRYFLAHTSGRIVLDLCPARLHCPVGCLSDVRTMPAMQSTHLFCTYTPTRSRHHYNNIYYILYKYVHTYILTLIFSFQTIVEVHHKRVSLNTKISIRQRRVHGYFKLFVIIFKFYKWILDSLSVFVLVS